MPAPAGASLRVVTVTPRTPKACDQRRQQRQRRLVGAAAAASSGPDDDAEILRDQQRPRRRRAASRRTVRPQADRGVDRLRAGMEEIQRPDVDGAAGEIDARRRRGRHGHGGIIMLHATMPSAASPSPRSAADRQLPRPHDLRGAAGAGPRVRPRRRRSSSPATSRRPSRCWSWPASARRSASKRRPGSASIRKAAASRGCASRSPCGRRWRRWAGAGSEALATRFAAALAAELRAVGITLDYAPVLDVHTNPKNPVIGDRALSDDARPGRARSAPPWCAALQGAGVAACGKHFPGHGDTLVDSHVELPIVEHAPDRLDAVEFEPFRAAIAADVAFMMTAHVLVPSLDEEWPATLSAPTVRRLRGRARLPRRRSSATISRCRRCARAGSRPNRRCGPSAPAATACSSAAATPPCRRRRSRRWSRRSSPGRCRWHASTTRWRGWRGQGAVPRRAAAAAVRRPPPGARSWAARRTSSSRRRWQAFL